MTVEEAKQRAASLKSRFGREFIVLLNEDAGNLIIREEDDKSMLPNGADCVKLWSTSYGEETKET